MTSRDINSRPKLGEKILLIYWRGPFDGTQIKKLDESGVLYLATGRSRWQNRVSIQYCGITEQSICHRQNGHATMSRITHDREFWVGWLAHRRQTTRADLELAESLLIYLWQFRLNRRKKHRLPKRTIIVSHWFDANWKPYQRKPAPVNELPDVMCWDTTHWRTGNCRGGRITELAPET
jgi:hypothetical protein